jgi:4-alpha-glucanotransferase
MTLWGTDEHFDPARLEAARSDSEHRDLEFWCWVQYHLHRQLTRAVGHVHSLGIALKGDLPIGVAPNSVETWTRPELFHLATQAGAPPDDFAVRGQNWGFPTYDWDAMASDEYQWWKDRFIAMRAYADAYRIDHILGFFRIWEIPADATDGLLGVFRPCKPLTQAEIESHLPQADLAWLTRPMIDTDVLQRRFGEFTRWIRELCFTGDDSDLRFKSTFPSQRAVTDASALGAFDGLGNRESVTRHLLDLRADAPLMQVEGGYHPRISWQATEAYQRLPAHEKGAFDTMATDFFHHRHTGLWRAQGMRSLPAVVDVTPLLPCGEDLGMVPDMVPALMEELGILSLEIERMPKTLGAWRADPSLAPYLSVVSPATHDMAPLRLWWAEDRSAAQRYWTEVLGNEGEAPEQASTEVCREIIAGHLASPAMLSVMQLQDLLATVPEARRPDIAAERVNVPADRHHRWRYRCHLDVGELPVRDWRRTPA